MRHIFHVTENHSPANFGVTEAVGQLTRYLTGQGWPTTVLSAGLAETQVPEGVGLVEFPLHFLGKSWRYPNNMKIYLENLSRVPGHILHLHGIWMAPQWLAARIAARQKIPALLTAHDMLSPWHWQHGYFRRLKKLIYWSIIAYPAFRSLTIVQALTLKERDYLAHHFPNQRLEIIPNAIDLEAVDRLIADTQLTSSLPISRPYVLFLGRLNPQKGVDILFNAFAQSLKGRDFQLVIAGPDSSPAYAAKLRSMVNLLGISKQVIFLGPVFGLQKWQLYRGAWACCLPSRSEGMSMVSLEVAAAASPLVTTYEAGILDWERWGGILVHPQVEELTRALDQVFSWGDQERQDRSRKLRQLVERRYSWQAVGPQWLGLYSELLEKYG